MSARAAAASRPVRSSALEARHAALGARWVDDTVRWPAGYARSGDGTGAGVRLAEIGPLEEWLLRGPGAVAAAHALDGGSGGTGGTAHVGRVTTTGAGIEAWLLGPDEVLLVAPVGGGGADHGGHGPGSAPGPAPDLAGTAARAATDDVSVIEMTGARTTIRLAGPAAPALLAELCPADTRPDTLAEGAVIQAPVAAVRAFIARRDSRGEPGYTLMFSRDEAAYLWDAIVELGGAHGLVVVGPDAIDAGGTP